VKTFIFAVKKKESKGVDKFELNMYWENKMRLRCEAKRMEIRIKRMNWKMYNVQVLGFWKRMWRNEERCSHFLYCVCTDDNHEIKNHPLSN